MNHPTIKADTYQNWRIYLHDRTSEPSDHQGGQQTAIARNQPAGVMLVGMLLWNVFATGETLFDSAGRKDVQE